MDETTRDAHDLTTSEWDPWIARVCGEIGIDPDVVDVPLLHALTKQVAHRFARPMAPVSAHLVGIALGRAMASDPTLDVDACLESLADAVVSTLPDDA